MNEQQRKYILYCKHKLIDDIRSVQDYTPVELIRVKAVTEPDILTRIKSTEDKIRPWDNLK